MRRIEFEFFQEAAGNRRLDLSEFHAGFKVFENDEIVDSFSFTELELEDKIERRKANGENVSDFERALAELREKNRTNLHGRR